MQKCYLAWQDSKSSRRWFPIGQLTYDGNQYLFRYVEGVDEAREKAGFSPLLAFPEFNREYASETLFPTFANRVLPQSRPDFKRFAEWLHADRESLEPIFLLSRSLGEKATDTFQVIPCPEPEGNKYRIVFFAHGIRHLLESEQKHIERLSPEDKLRVTRDSDNPVDPSALCLFTKDPVERVGWCPRFLRESGILECMDANSQSVQVRVLQVNKPPTPFNMRLLCEMTVCVPQGFRLFSKGSFQIYPLTQN